MENERAWSFRTARFEVTLDVAADPNFVWARDPEDGGPEGDIQAKLDAGELVALQATVTVWLDGVEITADHFEGAVYPPGAAHEFWTAHRDPDPQNRACSLNDTYAKQWFPIMIGEAVYAARQHLVKDPKAPRIRRRRPGRCRW